MFTCICLIRVRYNTRSVAEKPYNWKLKIAISTLDVLQKSDPYENVFYSPHSIFWSTEYLSDLLLENN